MATSAEDVLVILDLLGKIDVPAWVGGGWGVDALLGAQTREHDDVDLAIDAAHLDPSVNLLAQAGFVISDDWRPVRIALLNARDGIAADLHPVVFDASGNGVQQGLDGATYLYPASQLVTGVIAGRTVGCISPTLQLEFHLGYEPSEKDRLDMTALAERYALDVPDGYTQ